MDQSALGYYKKNCKKKKNVKPKSKRNKSNLNHMLHYLMLVSGNYYLSLNYAYS